MHSQYLAQKAHLAPEPLFPQTPQSLVTRCRTDYMYEASCHARYPRMSTLSLTLRKTCIFSFSPSFIILLIHGILTESPFPATGLIPLFFSALYSDICRRQASANARRTTGLSKSQSAIGHPLVDLIFAAAILPFLIVSWVYDMGDKWERWWSQPSLIVLGTYGSVGLLYNW